MNAKKHPAQVILLALIAFCLYSCKETNPVTKISGRIENPNQLNFNVRLYRYDYDSMRQVEKWYSGEMDENGNFSIEIPDLEAHCWNAWSAIGYVDHGLSLTAGDSLYIYLNTADQYKTIEYAGDGAGKNIYRAIKYVRYESYTRTITFDHLNELPFEEYYAGRKQYYEEMVALLDSVNAVEYIEPDYYNYEQTNLKFYFYDDVLEYEKRNGFKDADQLKELLVDASPNGVQMFEENVWFLKYIENYVRLMAYPDADPMACIDAAQTYLKGDMLNYYCYHQGAKFISDEDGATNYAKIKEAELSDFVSQFLTQKFERQQKLKEDFPNAKIEYVAYGPDLVPSTFLLQGHVGEDGDNNGEVLILIDGDMEGDKQTVILDKNRNFSVEIPIFHTHNIIVQLGSEYVYILASPGGNSYIDHANKLTSYYGDGARQNRKLNEVHKQVLALKDPLYKFMEGTVDPAEVEQAYKDRWAGQKAIIDANADSADFPVVNAWLTNAVAFDNLESMILVKPNLLWFASEMRIKLVNNSYYDHETDFLSLYQLDKTAFLNTQTGEFALILLNYRNSDCQAVAMNEIFSCFWTKAKEDFDQEWQELIYGIIFNNCLYNKQFDVLNALVDDYKSGDHYQWSKDNYEVKFQTALEAYNELKLPEDAVLNPVDSLSGEAFFDKVLAKHIGKVIYIDMWATWCGPCKAEFAFASAFHEGLDTAKVATVYFAGHSDPGSWENLIKEYQLSGDHYFLTDDQLSYFQREVSAQGFPTYTIIDQEGNIAEKSAGRPSQNRKVNVELIEKLNKM